MRAPTGRTANDRPTGTDPAGATTALALDAWAERLRRREVGRHARRAPLSPEAASLIEELSRSIVDAVLAPARRRLGHAACDGTTNLAEATCELFRLP